MRRFPNTLVAYEQGLRDGAKAERERLAKESAGDPESGGPPRLTLADVRAGKLSDQELLDRSAEVTALLAEEATR